MVTGTFAQTSKSSKYPSLFWEISGNGLKKPSYLFGTMHVSNKMAFHLSDSFYNAIKNTDMVALELNPEFWQKDMVKMGAAQQQLENFYKDNTTQYAGSMRKKRLIKKPGKEKLPSFTPLNTWLEIR